MAGLAIAGDCGSDQEEQIQSYKGANSNWISVR